VRGLGDSVTAPSVQSTTGETVLPFQWRPNIGRRCNRTPRRPCATAAADVRFGSLADVQPFAGTRLLSATNGHQKCRRAGLYPVHESSIINEYIDEALPGPKLTPDDALKRAHMRKFVKLCDEGLPAIALPTMVKYLLPKLRKRWGEDELRKRSEERPTEMYRGMFRRGIAGQVSDAELKQCFERIEGILDRMEAALASETGWVVGTFSLADIAVAPYLFRLSALGEERFWSSTNRPHVADWYRRILERESFQTAVSWPDENGGGYEEVGLHASLPTDAHAPSVE
jgi:glutathione S-transferase